MATKYRAVFQARCNVLPPETYPRQCPYISDGYRPNLSFPGAHESVAIPKYSIGFVEIPQGRLYAGGDGEVVVTAVIDDVVRSRLEPGLEFDLTEAGSPVAHCTIEDVLELKAT